MAVLTPLRPLRGLLARHRRTWTSGERLHAQLRRVEPSESEALRDRIGAVLTVHPAVSWAEVHIGLGRVVIGYDAAEVDVDELVGLIEAAESDCGLDGRPFEVVPYPADVEAVVEQAVKTAADVVGVGLSIFGRFVLPAPGRVRAVAATVTSVVQGVPRVRRFVQSRFDFPLTDVVLVAANAVAQGLGQGPLGPVSDLAHHGLLAGEAMGRHAVWLRREPALFEKPSGVRPPALIPPRPGPVPAGPVETFAETAWWASLGGAAFLLVSTRDPGRAAAGMQAGIPKAARYGREAFASGLGRALAHRGVLVMDPDSLRLLDRVDTMVVTADLLMTDDLVPGEFVVATGLDGDDLRRRVRRMFDPIRPASVVEADGWRLGPPDRLTALGLEPLLRRAGRLPAAGGPMLGVAREGRFVALVTTRPALRPEGEDLVALARRAGLEVVVALEDGGVAAPVEADRIVRGGGALPGEVRSLQAAGHVVVVVAGPGCEGFGAADIAVGLEQAGEPPPWGAHLICPGGLADAAMVVEACGAARAASRDAVVVAGLGASAAAFLAFRPLPGTGLRAGTAVNSAALVAMVNGTRTAVSLARQPRPLPRDPTPWHALSGQAALDRLGSGTGGLSGEEAERRLPPPERPLPVPLVLVRDVARELANPLTPVLAVGAGLSLLTGAPADAAMVGGVMVLNAVIGGVQHFLSDRAFAALERRGRQQTLVLRDGEAQLVDAAALVPGDVARFRAGDAVTADCRILEGTWIEVDESSLTGESFTVQKSPEAVSDLIVADRTSMLYDGTSLAGGEAVAVVVATGSATEARRALAGETGPPETGVEARLRRLTEVTIPVALGSGAVTIVSGLLRRQPVGVLVSGAVSLAVAAVPEGLPLLAGVAQLSAARRLAGKGVLVRNTRSVEALGRVDVMCVDKTGTVTEGRLRLTVVAHSGGIEDIGALTAGGRRVLRAALRATPAAPGQGRLPHPTDAAVVTGASRAGVGLDDGEATAWERIDEMPFQPERGFHATLGRLDSAQVLSVKGAPEVVLPRCAARAGTDGDHELDDSGRAALAVDLRRLTRQGLRVLAVGERSASDRSDLDDERVTRLTFLGFVAVADPVRPTAAEAVADLREAGVAVVMITGDHPSTAEGVATELGLLQGGSVVTGPELDDLDDNDLATRIAATRVFARVTPAHKVRIVRALQRSGKVVAMTGDGANDAPAIRLSDVGIALGKRSTAAARDAADLIVLDNRIETLVDAIAEGRGMWISVRDAVSLLVGGNLGEIAFAVGGSLLTGQTPLNARQLLLVNLLTDVAPAMAIAVQPPARRTFAELLAEGPEASLGRALREAIAWRAAFTGAAATGAFVAARLTGTPARARTVSLVALVGTQLGQTLVAGRPRPVTLASLAVSGAVLVAVVQTPGVSQLFGCTPLGPVGWTIGGTAAAIGSVGSILPRLVGSAQRPAPVGHHSVVLTKAR